MKLKKSKLSFAVFAGLSLAACTASRRTAYVFPAGMKPEVRSGFTAQADKGRILYDLHCGGCHNRMIGGKKVVPDFTPEQLAGYEIRMGNAEHERSLREDQLSAEELGLIYVYLTYKKPSGFAQPHDTTGRH